jgi:hypothetical protein
MNFLYQIRVGNSLTQVHIPRVVLYIQFWKIKVEQIAGGRQNAGLSCRELAQSWARKERPRKVY